jgi:outer membrane protein OmpA-like peptidoglycan-associated protein
MRGRSTVLALAAIMVLACACSGGGSGGKPSTGATSETPTTLAGESPSSLPPGATPGLDDYDGDGTLDPTCGTQDFGAGLVLRIPCEIRTANEPESGTTLVKDSLFRLPGSTDIDLTGISGSLVLARDAGGAKVVIVVFNTDNLFETGSADIGSTDTLDGTIRLLNTRYPKATVQVRGHTDSTGSATANQALSERRAATVRDYLTAHGLNATQVTSVGLGSAQPLAEEHTPTGADNPEGQRFNRRVEIVVRPAA